MDNNEQNIIVDEEKISSSNTESMNKEIIQQVPIQNNTQQPVQPIQDEEGQTYAYAAFGCGIASIALLFMVGANIALSIIGIVMSHLAVKHGQKDNSMRKVGLVLSWVSLGIIIALIVFIFILFIFEVSFWGNYLGGYI